MTSAARFSTSSSSPPNTGRERKASTMSCLSSLPLGTSARLLWPSSTSALARRPATRRLEWRCEGWRCSSASFLATAAASPVFSGEAAAASIEAPQPIALPPPTLLLPLVRGSPALLAAAVAAGRARAAT